MKIKQTAMAGTLESSDIQITLSDGQGVNVDLDSSVKALYGDEIIRVIKETLKEYDITDVQVKAVDKGALNCTIKARTMAAAQRALGTADQPKWEAF